MKLLPLAFIPKRQFVFYCFFHNKIYFHHLAVQRPSCCRKEQRISEEEEPGEAQRHRVCSARSRCASVLHPKHYYRGQSTKIAFTLDSKKPLCLSRSRKFTTWRRLPAPPETSNSETLPRPSMHVGCNKLSSFNLWVNELQDRSPPLTKSRVHPWQPPAEAR